MPRSTTVPFYILLCTSISSFVPSPKSIIPAFRLRMTQTPEDDQSQPKLILGEDLAKDIADGGFKWTQSAYVEMARKRAEEYKKNKEKGLLDDDATQSTIDPEQSAKRNFGPEDLSSFAGFPDEGWESSLKNNDMASLIAEPGRLDRDEEPSLFVPNDANGDDLILF